MSQFYFLSLNFDVCYNFDLACHNWASVLQSLAPTLIKHTWTS